MGVQRQVVKAADLGEELRPLPGGRPKKTEKKATEN